MKNKKSRKKKVDGWSMVHYGQPWYQCLKGNFRYGSWFLILSSKLGSHCKPHFQFFAFLLYNSLFTASLCFSCFLGVSQQSYCLIIGNWSLESIDAHCCLLTAICCLLLIIEYMLFSLAFMWFMQVLHQYMLLRSSLMA